MAVEPLAYVDTGGDFPVIAFIHGMTFSKETWDPILDRLRKRFRCVAVDLPGHGESSGSGADPVAVVERIHTTLLASGAVRPVIVGHSAGAIHATGYASAHETAGVVNVDQPLAVGPFAEFVQQLGPALRGPDFPSAFAPFVASIGVGRLPAPERDRVLGTQTISQELVLDHWSQLLTKTPGGLQSDVDELLERVTVPYLWLVAGPVQEAARDHLLSRVRAAQVESWADQGHMSHLAEPDRFAERLAGFANSVR